MSLDRIQNLAERRAIGATTLGLASVAGLSAAFGQTLASNQPIETVNVTAERTSIDKLTEKVLSTPQSINIVPQQVMQQQGVQTVQDALKNVPGITLNAGEGGAHGDTVNLRGFSASDDFFIDGLRDTGTYFRDSFDMEALEVYKGPASTLFGRGSTGGVINQVTKTPETYPIDEIVLTGGTNDEGRATGDFNYVFDDTTAARLNLMGQTSGYAGRDFVRNRRFGVAPSIAFGMGEPTTFMLSWFHQQEDNVPDYGIPFINGKPAPVPRGTDYGLINGDLTQTDADIVTAKLKHDFSDTFSITDTARYGYYWFNFRVTAPHYGDANCYTGSAPFAGAPVCTGAATDVPVTATDPLEPVPGMPLDQIYVQRDRPTSKGTITTLMNETDATWKFITGPLAHTLVGGVEVDREVSDLTRFANQDDEIVATPLLDPNPYEAFPGTQTTVTSLPKTTASTVGIYAIDTVAIGPHFNVIGAVRYDHFDVTYDQPFNGTSGTAHFHHIDNVTSPRAALVYKPDENSSIYFSYGTSFNPSAENLSLSSRNADLGPEKDRTFEIGGKTQVFGGLLSLTAAAFNTEMTNARVGDPDDPFLQVLSGKQRVNGFELGASGYITQNWEIVAGYTYLESETDKSTDPTQIGKQLPNTARNQANLWTVYDFESGWKLGAGLNFVGERYADLQNTAKIPSYVTYDAMAAYRVFDNLTLQLNGYNLTNKYYYLNSYWSTPDENHVIPGAGRTFMLSAVVDF